MGKHFKTFYNSKNNSSYCKITIHRRLATRQAKRLNNLMQTMRGGLDIFSLFRVYTWTLIGKESKYL